ncbi:MAG: trypsin-like peptidase domain-containing protein [Solirubrobacteraceae bacterium]|jgi:putative serine protease PepD|nr:trypsin-like peptidase domain-containing protein [Solirubrobacteraceae bacterium]
MPAERPLWADPIAREPERAWLERPTQPLPPREPRDEEPPEPPRGGGRRWLIAALAVSLLALAGVTGALIAGGNDGGSLPTVAGGKVPESKAGAVYAAVRDGVVQIRAGSGSGSGFVVKDDGTVVTNAHVVGESKTVGVIFNDSDKPVRGRVLGTDPSTDLAVVRVDPDDAPRLRPLPLGDSESVQVGDQVIAIGYPLGLDRTVTAGIVSGLGREIEAPNGFSIDKVIQTDAPINPGNSGGPLLDQRGRVIGVNSQIATAGTPGNVGIGFAVPSNTVRDIAPKLETGTTIARPYLGVSTSEPLTGSGALVRSVVAGGPAARAGLRAASKTSGEGGDVIVAVNGRPVSTPEDVAAGISSSKPGDRVSVVVIRDGRRQTLEITLGTRPTRLP